MNKTDTKIDTKIDTKNNTKRSAERSAEVTKHYKRRHNKTGRRVMVGVKLTPEELSKLEGLIKAYTVKTGMQETKSSVLSYLIEEAA